MSSVIKVALANVWCYGTIRCPRIASTSASPLDASSARMFVFAICEISVSFRAEQSCDQIVNGALTARAMSGVIKAVFDLGQRYAARVGNEDFVDGFVEAVSGNSIVKV